MATLPALPTRKSLSKTTWAIMLFNAYVEEGTRREVPNALRSFYAIERIHHVMLHVTLSKAAESQVLYFFPLFKDDEKMDMFKIRVCFLALDEGTLWSSTATMSDTDVNDTARTRQARRFYFNLGLVPFNGLEDIDCWVANHLYPEFEDSLDSEEENKDHE
jgi:hypothetical protein